MMDEQDEARRRQDRAAMPLRPRTPRRHRVLQQGRIVLGPDTLLACTVRDLSPAGARIVLSRPVALPATFDLVIAAYDLRTVSVHLRWQKGEVAGVTFAGAGEARA